MTVGEVIKKCRWGNGLSQRMLSEASSIARQTIADAELGRRSTSVSVLVTLLDAMGYELLVAEKCEKPTKFRKTEAVIER